MKPINEGHGVEGSEGINTKVCNTKRAPNLSNSSAEVCGRHLRSLSARRCQPQDICSDRQPRGTTATPRGWSVHQQYPEFLDWRGQTWCKQDKHFLSLRGVFMTVVAAWIVGCLAIWRIFLCVCFFFSGFLWKPDLDLNYIVWNKFLLYQPYVKGLICYISKTSVQNQVLLIW